MDKSIITQKDFAQRRNQLFSYFQNGLIYLHSQQPVLQNADENFPFVQNSYIWYLTGIDFFCAIILDCETKKYLLFKEEITTVNKIWNGNQLSDDELKELYCVDEVHSLSELDSYLQQKIIRSIPNANNNFDTYIDESLYRILVDMRMIKSQTEIQCIQNAQIMSKTLFDSLDICVGKTELDVKKQIDVAYIEKNTQHSFTPIVTKDAQIIHNTSYDNILFENDLLLIDTGCRFENYCSDITRTVSLSSFTAKQQIIYDLVQKLQKYIISQIKPGINFSEIRQKVLCVLVDNLIHIGILVGDKDELYESTVSSMFLPHSFTHSIGLDVHDCADAKEIVQTDKGVLFKTGIGFQRVLQENMVLTVEPGIYFIDEYVRNLDNYPQFTKFVNKKVFLEFAREVSGIRIEDIIVVKKTGCRVL